MFYRMLRNITVAILLLLPGLQAQNSVTLSSQSLYVTSGSTVQISCTFTTPHYSRDIQSEWYKIQCSERPKDLSKDPQYSGRVSVSTLKSDCKLTLWNVRVSDSGVYNFRFKTETSDWISASSGIHLTVTDVIAETYWFPQGEVWRLIAVWGAAALVPAVFIFFLIHSLCTEWRREAERNTGIQSIPVPGDDTHSAKPNDYVHEL